MADRKGKQGDQGPSALTVAVIAVVIFILYRALTAEPPAVPEKLTGDITHVHDPALVKDGDTWYLFSTGWGIPIRRSSDLAHWDSVGSVFPHGLPGWVRKQVPALPSGELSGWAPDVSKGRDGRWHLYWSIGVFGSTKAVIGHASNASLDPSASDYKWVDEGPVVTSGGRGDNSAGSMAIDPDAVVDEKGDPWLAWGSFGHGIMLRRLDPKTGSFLVGSHTFNLARRDPFFLGIEGADLVRKDGWWYLFVSFGFCCRGTSSQYSVHVGRSRAISGPYVDEAGAPMLRNGGTTVVGSYANVVGPGHSSVVKNGNSWVLANHFYDRNDHGTSTLMLRPLAWGPDGWPISPDAGFDSDRVDAADVEGRWHIVGYPEDAPARPPDDVIVDLRKNHSVAPSGTWTVDRGIVHITNVKTRHGPRNWWFVLDPDKHMAFGRDNRTAAVRALHG